MSLVKNKTNSTQNVIIYSEARSLGSIIKWWQCLQENCLMCNEFGREYWGHVTWRHVCVESVCRSVAVTSEHDRIYADRDDCRSYFYCFAGQVHMSTCSAGLFFHSDLQSCHQQRPHNCHRSGDWLLLIVRINNPASNHIVYIYQV